MEIWKTITKFEEYQISNLGNVKSLKFGKERYLKAIKRSGYLRVELNSKAFSIHRLVAQEFINNPENKEQINHINGIKHDNRLENLEWCTQSENIKHAITTGLKISSKGEKNGASKLKESDIFEIRKSDLSSRNLGLIYGVDKSIILDVKNLKTWKHI